LRHCTIIIISNNEIMISYRENYDMQAPPRMTKCVARNLVQCFTLDGTNKKRGIFGSGKAQTAAIPGGIARIGNTARAEKTLFYVPDSVKHCTSTPFH
jgi:hypothetical protein